VAVPQRSSTHANRFTHKVRVAAACSFQTHPTFPSCIGTKAAWCGCPPPPPPPPFPPPPPPPSCVGMPACALNALADGWRLEGLSQSPWLKWPSPTKPRPSASTSTSAEVCAFAVAKRRAKRGDGRWSALQIKRQGEITAPLRCGGVGRGPVSSAVPSCFVTNASKLTLPGQWGGGAWRHGMGRRRVSCHGRAGRESTSEGRRSGRG